MKYKVFRYTNSEETHVCRNCGNTFKGKICNNCGEKLFNEKHLTTKHFLHQIVDFFTHFENKVLKSIWLNIVKPGFITKQNLEGIRVPYANPIQLYLVVSILFYFTVTKIGVNDYTPEMGDHRFNPISAYYPFTRAAPLDSMVITGIDNMADRKIASIKKEVIENHFSAEEKTAGGYKVYDAQRMDSTYVQPGQVNAIAGNEAERIFLKDFYIHVSAYSKTLIFCMLPFMAGLLFLLFYKQLKYYGASLILATHFMVFNLCAFIVHCLVDWLPARIFNTAYHAYWFAPFRLLYKPGIEPITTFLFGGSFEMLNLIFWLPWLFFAFKRLFGKPWWYNLLAAYLCGRVFYFLVFGVLKKVLIAYTIWTMH